MPFFSPVQLRPFLGEDYIFGQAGAAVWLRRFQSYAPACFESACRRFNSGISWGKITFSGKPESRVAL